MSAENLTVANFLPFNLWTAELSQHRVAWIQIFQKKIFNFIGTTAFNSNSQLKLCTILLARTRRGNENYCVEGIVLSGTGRYLRKILRINRF